MAQIEIKFGDMLPMILILLGIQKENPEFLSIEEEVDNTVAIEKPTSRLFSVPQYVSCFKNITQLNLE